MKITVHSAQYPNQTYATIDFDENIVAADLSSIFYWALKISFATLLKPEEPSYIFLKDDKGNIL